MKTLASLIFMPDCSFFFGSSSISFCGALTLALWPDLHNEVQERGFHILEPVGHARRDDNHITLVELMCVAAIDAAAAHFVRASAFAVEHLAAGHKGGGAVDNIEDIGVSFMQFGSGRAGLLAMRRHDCVVAIFPIKKGAAFFKSGAYLGTGIVEDSVGWSAWASSWSTLLASSGHANNESSHHDCCDCDRVRFHVDSLSESISYFLAWSDFFCKEAYSSATSRLFSELPIFSAALAYDGS